MLAAAAYPGALLGPALAYRIPRQAFLAAFGALLLCLSVWLLLRGPGWPAGGRRRRPGRRRWWLAGAASAAAGCVASLFGVGGGPLQVPVMLYLLGLPPLAAIATSQLIILCTAVVGAVVYLRAGAVPAWPAAALAGGAAVGAWLGARAAGRLPARALVVALAVALAATGVRLLWPVF